MRFFNKLNSVLDAIDSGQVDAGDSGLATVGQSSTPVATATEVSSREPTSPTASPPSLRSGDLGQSWSYEEVGTEALGAVPNLTDGRTALRSPAPSLGAQSVTTSGGGTDAYVKVDPAEVPPRLELMADARGPSSEAFLVGGGGSGSSPGATGGGAASAASRAPPGAAMRGGTPSPGNLSSESASSKCLGSCPSSGRTDEEASVATGTEAGGGGAATPASTPEAAAAGALLLHVTAPAGGLHRHGSGGRSPSSCREEEDEEVRAAAAEAAGERERLLERRLEAAEAQAAAQSHAAAEARDRHEEQLIGASQQLERLQARITELEAEASRKDDELKQALLDAQQRLDGQELQQRAEDLQQQVGEARRRAHEEAEKEKEAALAEVAQEMERELGRMLKQKDEQVKLLQDKVKAMEKTNRQQKQDLEKRDSEVEALRGEVSELRRSGDARMGDHKKELNDAIAEHRQQLEDLARRREVEERQRHELTLNLHDVEQRSRAEVSRLEVEKSQLELQLNGLQAQLEAQHQRYEDLSSALGEATQEQLARAVSDATDEARRRHAAEEHVLRERVASLEDRLGEAQRACDAFAKETDVYRAELGAAQGERRHLEEELARVQELQQRPPSAAQAQTADLAAAQQTQAALQKDFEDRTERYRDEVGYLRQKCDEKERRCEQLLAEKSSLLSDLRNLRGGQAPGADAGAWSIGRDLEAGGGKGASAAAAAGPDGKGSGNAATRLGIRALPLSVPSWLRSTDEPCRLIVRVLATSPPARLAFFGYVVLLHAWVLFILQDTASSTQASLESTTPS